MVTEKVEILVQERGTKVTSKAIQGVGRSAKTAATAVERLQKLLKTTGTTFSQLRSGITDAKNAFTGLDRSNKAVSSGLGAVSNAAKGAAAGLKGAGDAAAKGAAAQQRAVGAGVRLKNAIFAVDKVFQSLATRTRRVRTLIADIGRAFARLGRGAVSAARGIASLGRRLRSVGRAVTSFRALVSGLFVGLAVRGIIRAADAFTLMGRAIGQSTRETGDAAAVQRELLAISNRTFTSITDNASAFQRFSIATRQLGASNADVLELLEGLNAAMLLSGTNAQEARGGLIQLGQGLASGRLAGDELRGVLEALPALAQELSREIGVELSSDIEITVGQLRELGAAGRLTGNVVFPALQRAVRAFTGRLDEIQPTVSEVVTILRNSFIVTIGELNKELGGTSGLNKILLDLAGNMRENLFNAAIVVVKSLASIVRGAVAVAVGITRLIDQFRRLRLRVFEARLENVKFLNVLRTFGRFLPGIGAAFVLLGKVEDVEKLREEFQQMRLEAVGAALDAEILRQRLLGFGSVADKLEAAAEGLRELRDNPPKVGPVSTSKRGKGQDPVDKKALEAQAGALEKLLAIQLQLTRAVAAEGGERQLAIFDLRQQIIEARTLATTAGFDPSDLQLVRDLEDALGDLLSQTDFGQNLATNVTGALEGAFQSALEGDDFFGAFGEGLKQSANQALVDGLSESFDALQEGLGKVFDGVANSLTELFKPVFGAMSDELGSAISGVLSFVVQQGLAAALGGTNASQSAAAGGIRSAVTSTQDVRGIVAGPQSIAIAQVGDNIATAVAPLIDLASIRNSILGEIRDNTRGGGLGGTVVSADAEEAAFGSGSTS